MGSVEREKFNEWMRTRGVISSWHVQQDMWDAWNAALREQPEARGVVDEDDPKNWPERASDMKPLPWLRRMRRFHINYPETVAMIDEEIAALTAAQQPVQEGGGVEFCVDEGCPQHGTAHVCVKPAPPSAPVGVEGLAGLLEQIRDLLASLPVDCLGTDTAADGQPYPIRDEVIHSITKALTQQPAQSAPGCTCPSGDGSLRWPCPTHPPGDDAAGWKLVPVEPTEKMFDAGFEAASKQYSIDPLFDNVAKVYAIYGVMLAVCHTAPVQDPPGDADGR